MKLNIKTEDVSIEFEMDPEEFAQVMAFRLELLKDPEYASKYFANIGTFLKFITKEMKNVEEHR